MTGVAFDRDVVPIAEIGAGDRLRPVDEAAVAAMMASLQAEGLMQPIGVIWEGARASIHEAAPYTLAWGLHRLEAARRLGWTEIEASVVRRSALAPGEAVALEAMENLSRADLAPYDRAVAVAALRDAMKTSAKGARSVGGFEESANFALSATIETLAERLGRSVRSVKYDLDLAAILHPATAAVMRGRDGWDTATVVAACARLEAADLIAWLDANPEGGLRDALGALSARSTVASDFSKRSTLAFGRIKDPKVRVETALAIVQSLTARERFELLGHLKPEAIDDAA